MSIYRGREQRGKGGMNVQRALCYSYIGLWEWCCVIEERNVDDERNVCGVCLTYDCHASMDRHDDAPTQQVMSHSLERVFHVTQGI